MRADPGPEARGGPRRAGQSTERPPPEPLEIGAWPDAGPDACAAGARAAARRRSGSRPGFRRPARRRAPGWRSRRRGRCHSPRPHVPVDRCRSSAAERDLGDLDRGRDGAVRGSRAMPPTTSCVRPERRSRNAARLGLVGRLAEDVAVERDVGVGAEHQLARRRDGQRLAPRVLLGDPRGSPRVSSSTPETRTSNGMPDLLEDRPPLRRAPKRAIRGRGRTASPRARRTPAESEPWTMFWPTATAKSPRIEPVVASSGLVAPMTWRAAARPRRPRARSRRAGRR